jgi:hypothetical protein
MASCAWEGFGPAGFPFPGRPTCVQFATLVLGRSNGELPVFEWSFNMIKPTPNPPKDPASSRQPSIMASDLAGFLDSPHRNALLGIAQIIMLGELAVNRALDNLDPQDQR